MPFWLTVLVYLLFYYCVLLAVGLISDSTGWHATAIIVGNISVNFLIPFLLSLPSVSGHRQGADGGLDRRHRRDRGGRDRVPALLALGLACLPPIAHRGLRVEEHIMSTHDRLHALDAVRAFALLLGVVFHAGFSFIPGMIPGIWAINDNSPSVAISVLLFVVAHLPDVAVLLRRRLLRADAVPAQRRPRLLDEPAQAHPACR